MKSCLFGFLLFGNFLPAMAPIATADEVKDEAIRQDRKIIEGTWRVIALEVNGKKAKAEDARKLIVVNSSDGTWSLRSEEQVVSEGTSLLDPTQKPKTIDFTPTEGEEHGHQHLGIYEIGDATRKLCFAPAGKERPNEFSSPSGSGHILVTFERVKIE